MFMIQKDGLWLMGCQPSGRMEVIGDGRLADVPVCMWGEHMYEAIRFDDRNLADRIAKVIGAEVIKNQKRG